VQSACCKLQQVRLDCVWARRWGSQLLMASGACSGAANASSSDMLNIGSDVASLGFEARCLGHISGHGMVSESSVVHALVALLEHGICAKAFNFQQQWIERVHAWRGASVCAVTNSNLHENTKSIALRFRKDRSITSALIRAAYWAPVHSCGRATAPLPGRHASLRSTAATTHALNSSKSRGVPHRQNQCWRVR
jgi:hypothetical protein